MSIRKIITSRAVLVWMGRLAIIVGFIGLWEYSADRWVDSFWVSRPTDVGKWIYDRFADGTLPKDIKVTMKETLLGFTYGAIGGLILGIVLSRFKLLADILDPFIVAINGIPRTALAPLLVVWFGIGIKSKIVLVVSLVLFLVFFNTYAGLRSVPREYVQTARSFGAKGWQIMWKVSLPSASPWIFTSLKLAIPYGLVGAIVGEFIASSAGLGYLVALQANLYNAEGAIGVLVVLAAIVMILNFVLEFVERRLLRWRPDDVISSTRL
ncbi:MAG TPA: ABC transporter permease [Dehalococcoidia bacterium]